MNKRLKMFILGDCVNTPQIRASNLHGIDSNIILLDLANFLTAHLQLYLLAAAALEDLTELFPIN